MSFFKQKKYLFSILLVLCSLIFTVKPAFSQIDYSYGLNKKGVRLSLGLGGNTIQTTWSQTPVGYTLVGGLSYDFSQYFSLIAEGQYGSMTGVDGTNTFTYSQSVNSYQSATVSLRFSLGLLTDFPSKNGFMDAIKRGYLSIGYGDLFSDVTLTKASNVALRGTTVTLYQVTATTYKSTKVYTTTMVPVSIGTNFAMPGVWGDDRVEINPNIQYNLFREAFADGYQPTVNSTNGGYVLISVSLRYKF